MPNDDRMTDDGMQDEAPFSSRTRVALSIARALAAAMGHDDVTDAHVMIGILREGENPAVAALQHAGVPLERLRQELEQALPPLGRPRPREVARPLTKGERRLVARGDVERRRLRHRPLGTEHLLLAAVHDEMGPVAQALARHGVRYDTVPDHLAAVLHYHP
jgi:ATP-dependent Clp protease ATP-binding subunit ClpC